MAKKSDERVLTLHPDAEGGKRGVRIEKAKYDGMRRALLRVVPRRKDGVAFRELSELVEPHLPADVFGPDVSRSWYVTVVKQDLEARGTIEQVPGARPQRVRRK
jgi:hypothetical protein